MAKRRTRSSSPNIPAETLERARRQAMIERGELPPDPEPVASPAPVETPAPPISAVPSDAASVPRTTNPYRTTTASQRRAATRARTGQGTRQPAALTQEQIAELLHNPTRTVSEDELRRDYGYVLADIRNMGALALALIVLLIALAQVLPR